jgi:hypothetical protein
MPRHKPDPEEAKIKKQQRNQKYRENIIAKERNKEHDRLYRQRKREQERLKQHGDPLAQLADTMTQKTYLEVENELLHGPRAIEVPQEEDEEPIDVAGTVEEDGEVLENFGNDDGFGGLDDGGFLYTAENGWSDDFNNEVNSEGSLPGICN